MTDPRPERQQEQERRLSWWQVLRSAVAAMFGVQRSEHHARDFAHGKAAPFIIAGVVLTLLFILTVYGVVRIVLHLTGI